MVSVEVVPDQVAHLLEGSVSVSWARGILTVDTPAHRVIYNGKTLDVMNKAVFAAGDQCGLCGDHNRMRLSDIKSSSQCVHTSLLSMAHSYRVNSAIEQCSPLSSSPTSSPPPSASTPPSSPWPTLQGEQRHRAVLSPVLLCRREALQREGHVRQQPKQPTPGQLLQPGDSGQGVAPRRPPPHRPGLLLQGDAARV